MLYCHTLHRFDDFDLEFCREVRKQGLDYRVIAAEGACRPEEAGDDLDPLADEGQGFLEELFPTKRIVVFQILQQGDVKLGWSLSLAKCSEADVDRGSQGSVGAPTMAALTASAKMVQVVDGEPILNQRKDD
eukprot:symbB.v1.2.017250.t1/scaffold1346.1/size178581/3